MQKARLQEAETMLDVALAALSQENSQLLEVLEGLTAPIYVTDADGFVTYFNRACIGFTGRYPLVGKDRWCVTWKLYTNAGAFLPHDQCPMAQAIQGKSSVRGLTAVAERPDGTRVTFMPFPTPIFDRDGKLTGAVNMLIDVTENRQAADLREKAAHFRRMAQLIYDENTQKALTVMANECDAKAKSLDAQS